MINHYNNEYIEKNLDNKTQRILILSTLTAIQDYFQIKEAVPIALNESLTAEKIQEAIYHAASYCGHTMSINTILAAILL